MSITELKPAGRNLSTTILNPQSLDEAMRMADLIAKSTIVPKDYQGNPGNVLVAIQWGLELGLQPLQAMQNIAVINGRPSLWGDAVLALCKSSPLCEYITESFEDHNGNLTAVCTAKNRQDHEPVRQTFSMADAKLAGLANKPGPWQQYPRRMLQMRARAYALRDAFPTVLMGINVAEESQDIRTVTGEAETTGPTKTAGGVAGLKARLQPVAQAEPAPDSPPPAEPGPDFQALLSAIETSKTPEELEQYRPQVRALKGQEKRMAVAAWKEREAALTPPHDPVATIAAAIAAATSAEDLKALMPMFDPLSEDQVDAIYGQYTAKMESLIPSPSE